MPEYNVDKRFKILLGVVILFLFVTVLLSYYRYMVLQDFIVISDEDSSEMGNDSNVNNEGVSNQDTGDFLIPK